MSLARDMARRPKPRRSARSSPAFVALHREHMKDEARHLHIDGLLIDLCLGRARGRAGASTHGCSSRCCGASRGRPARGSGVKVIRQLVRDMPELARARRK